MSADQTHQVVMIWSAEHRGWWRLDGRGYTDDSAHAWHLPRADAERITAHCGPEKRITIQAAPLHRQVVA